MTDSVPTDDWQADLNKLKAVYNGLLVGCVVGGSVDTSILKQVTNEVVSLQKS